MWYVVGLGNPGEEYVSTRHNTGRIMLEAFRIYLENAKGKLKKEKITLLAPDTFMNNSGKALKSLITNVKKAEKLIVIQDDFNFPVGKFRISFNRSSGGHNGVESVIKSIKTEAFNRVRVGISSETPAGKLKSPHGSVEVEKLILGEFKKTELDTLKKLSKKVALAIETIILEGREKAMTEFNGN
ncbi:MAG: aminoacyl-tRNA hydrolase [Candidatus Taylorbacteria bacterium]|nr:aminoacyl-tRNA hydrolase [Candidatus Taylorbacteria bacterium]